MRKEEFKRAVYDLVRKIPRGKVTTYGEIARKLGGLRYARAVGQALKRNRNPDVPCHRVVRSNGELGGYSGGGILHSDSHSDGEMRSGADGVREKERLLREEGIEIVNGKIDLERFLFRFH